MFFGALLYGERVTGLGLFAALVTYTGLAIVFALDLPAGGRNTIIGTLLVLGAAISFARMHQIYAKRFMAPLGSALFTAIALASASFFCIAHQVCVRRREIRRGRRRFSLAVGRNARSSQRCCRRF